MRSWENWIMRWCPWCCAVFFAAASGLSAAEDAPAPDYAAQVAPLLKKYCVGCHNPSEKEGELSLATFADMQRGGSRGPALLAGDGASSRLVRVLGGAEPKMPPEGEPAPTAEEVARAIAESGAGGEVRQFASPREALAAAQGDAGDGDRIAVFGSFYTVAEVMAARTASSRSQDAG